MLEPCRRGVWWRSVYPRWKQQPGTWKAKSNTPTTPVAHFSRWLLSCGLLSRISGTTSTPTKWSRPDTARGDPCCPLPNQGRRMGWSSRRQCRPLITRCISLRFASSSTAVWRTHRYVPLQRTWPCCFFYGDLESQLPLRASCLWCFLAGGTSTSPGTAVFPELFVSTPRHMHSCLCVF